MSNTPQKSVQVHASSYECNCSAQSSIFTVKIVDDGVEPLEGVGWGMGLAVVRKVWDGAWGWRWFGRCGMGHGAGGGSEGVGWGMGLAVVRKVWDGAWGWRWFGRCGMGHGAGGGSEGVGWGMWGWRWFGRCGMGHVGLAVVRKVWDGACGAGGGSEGVGWGMGLAVVRKV